MKKIILLLLSFVLFNSCKINTPPPPVTYNDNPNTQDVIYPIHTLTGRNGNAIVGYMYEIDGNIYIYSILMEEF